MKRAICILCLLTLCLTPGLSLAGATLSFTYTGDWVNPTTGYQLAGIAGEICDGDPFRGGRLYKIDEKGARKTTVQLGDPAGGGDTYELQVHGLGVLYISGVRWGQTQYSVNRVSGHRPCNHCKIKPVNGRIDMELSGYTTGLNCKLITGQVIECP